MEYSYPIKSRRKESMRTVKEVSELTGVNSAIAKRDAG